MTWDWVQWQALVNMGMNEHVTQKTAEQLPYLMKNSASCSFINMYITFY